MSISRVYQYISDVVCTLVYYPKTTCFDVKTKSVSIMRHQPKTNSFILFVHKNKTHVKSSSRMEQYGLSDYCGWYICRHRVFVRETNWSLTDNQYCWFTVKTTALKTGLLTAHAHQTVSLYRYRSTGVREGWRWEVVGGVYITSYPPLRLCLYDIIHQDTFLRPTYFVLWDKG